MHDLLCRSLTKSIVPSKISSASQRHSFFPCRHEYCSEHLSVESRTSVLTSYSILSVLLIFNMLRMIWIERAFFITFEFVIFSHSNKNWIYAFYLLPLGRVRSRRFLQWDLNMYLPGFWIIPPLSMAHSFPAQFFTGRKKWRESFRMIWLLLWEKSDRRNARNMPTVSKSQEVK